MNTECLVDMQCPECGSYEPLRIEVRTMIQFTDEGEDFYNDKEEGDRYWDDDHVCVCCECGHTATVGAFKEGYAG